MSYICVLMAFLSLPFIISIQAAYIIIKDTNTFDNLKLNMN